MLTCSAEVAGGLGEAPPASGSLAVSSGGPGISFSDGNVESRGPAECSTALLSTRSAITRSAAGSRFVMHVRPFYQQLPW